MALPKIDLPIYQCELPSTGKKIRFRPFTVKEEKILLTAKETEETSQMILAIKQILNNCLVEKAPTDLASFDIEYLLIQIRSKSVDNKAEFEIIDPDTNETVKLTLDLSAVKVKKSENHTNKIRVSDEYTLFLKYPTIEQLEHMMERGEKRDLDDGYEIMIMCLDKLASKDEVYNFKDFSKKEISDFVESLPSDSIKGIRDFFDNMPKVRHEMKYTNSKGEEKVFVIEGTKTFFM